jgi:hypothetical protein
MSLMGRTYKAAEFDAEAAARQRHPELRRIAASKLATFHSHEAGKGSHYVTLGDSVKVRFADHENTSTFHERPDYNCVRRKLTPEEIAEIKERVLHPVLCKKAAFAKHVGMTVPALKKLLDASCYEDVCENPEYPNTFTQYVRVTEALKCVDAAGITTRVPVAQERWTVEDYAGW